MEVIKNNNTELELNDGELSSVSSLPRIPDCICRLYIKMPALMELPGLPDNLEGLEVENAPLHGISSLPQKLSVIKLEYLSNLNQLNNLPGELKVLKINNCDSLNLPMNLPHSLEELSVFSYIKIKWGIESLPHSLNKLNLGNVYIELNVLKGHDNLKRNGFDVKATLDFNIGDVVYGLAHSRSMITRELVTLYDEREIVIQNTLTNSVWDRSSPEEFSNDETIAQRLRDIERGVAFRDFLARHPKYNVTTQSSEHRAYSTDTKRWIKTSKAGLEFQTMVRKNKVIFCVDEIIDSISDIAKKTYPNGRSITASELRWLYRHREDPDIKSNVSFYLRGEPVSQEHIFSLDEWKEYLAKSDSNTN